MTSRMYFASKFQYFTRERHPLHRHPRARPEDLSTVPLARRAWTLGTTTTPQTPAPEQDSATAADLKTGTGRRHYIVGMCVRRFHLPDCFKVSGSSGPTGASLGLSLPDDPLALTALEPPLTTITERRMPTLALTVREPGSLSDDVTSVWRLRTMGITGCVEFGYHADNVGMFLVRRSKFSPSSR